MLGGRSVSKVVAVVATVIAALSVAGLIATAVLSDLVFNRFDAHGEISIPGESTVYLPAGMVSVNFLVRTDGDSTAVPPLHMNIEPPPGVADPEVRDDLGSSVSAGNEVHRQVWTMRVLAEGGYRIRTDGAVAGYIEPRLTFGDANSPDGLIWVLVAVSMVTSDIAVAAWWLRRRNRVRDRPAAAAPGPEPAIAAAAVTATPAAMRPAVPRRRARARCR